MMLHGEENPTLARDTLFAVVMIILNGMVGASLLIGGWRHREQYHNLQGANAYLGAVIPLVVLGLVLPDFTQSTAGPTLSFVQQLFLVVVSVGLYGAFLALQTGRHRDYFAALPSPTRGEARSRGSGRLAVVVGVLLLVMHVAGAAAGATDGLSGRLRRRDAARAGVARRRDPRGAGRDARGARRGPCGAGEPAAALGQHLPRLGAVDDRHHDPGDGDPERACGQTIVLGVQHADLVLLLLTLVVSIVTFSSGRTNIMQGLIHLILFMAYLLLIFRD